MMGKHGGQIPMVILDIDSMIPEYHLLRRIKYDRILERCVPILFAGRTGKENRQPSNRLPALFMPGEKAQRSILHAFTFEKLCDGHALWMFHIQT